MNDSETAVKKNEAGKVTSGPEVKRGFLGGIFAGLVTLLQGMWVTLSYLVRPSTVVTQQYPENRETLKMTERFRSMLSMIHDNDGYHNCTTCGICVTACPNVSINVVSKKDAAGKKVLDRYIWRMDSCTFCNACVVACPFGAITMTGKFESAVYDRSLLVFALNKYAGPPASALKKIEDPVERKKMIEPCTPYSGHTLLDVPAAALPAGTPSGTGGK